MSKEFEYPTILNPGKRDPDEGEVLLGLLREMETPIKSEYDLPSRFQIGDTVNASGKRGRVVCVTFAYVDFHDGCGEGGKIYYTVEFPGGARKEFMSNDVSPALKLAGEVIE